MIIGRIIRQTANEQSGCIIEPTLSGGKAESEHLTNAQLAQQLYSLFLF